jgi:hypothetical protein
MQASGSRNAKHTLDGLSGYCSLAGTGAARDPVQADNISKPLIDSAWPQAEIWWLGPEIGQDFLSMTGA